MYIYFFFSKIQITNPKPYIFQYHLIFLNSFFTKFPSNQIHTIFIPTQNIYVYIYIFKLNLYQIQIDIIFLS